MLTQGYRPGLSFSAPPALMPRNESLEGLSISVGRFTENQITGGLKKIRHYLLNVCHVQKTLFKYFAVAQGAEH
jgi:hypothetical protein